MHTTALIADLKEVSHSQKAPLWTRIAKELARPTRQKRVVNISRLNRYTKANDVIVVPGKVLGSGSLGHSLTVAAHSFSNSAKIAIEQAKGKAITINELIKLQPKGKNVRIIG